MATAISNTYATVELLEAVPSTNVLRCAGKAATSSRLVIKIFVSPRHEPFPLDEGRVAGATNNVCDT
jgi:hypothetical protein